MTQNERALTATIAALEERGLDYILGARERGTAAVREIVLKDGKPFAPLLAERGRGDTQLFVKEITVDGARYIVCRNEAEAAKDRADRQAIVANLEKRLSGGDKALIGNVGHRRYLCRTGAGRAFEIDAGKLAEEARFDGIFVLRTNARTPCRGPGRARFPGRRRRPPGQTGTNAPSDPSHPRNVVETTGTAGVTP